MALKDCVKPWVLELEPYQPGKPPEELERELGVENAIKLASNESPIGPSPRAMEAVRKTLTGVHRYPDGASFALRSALAQRLGVKGEQLVFGAGADEILELLAKAFLGPGDQAVYAWPSFAMYPIVTQGMGAQAVPVPLRGDLVHDLDAMRAAVVPETRVVFVCNPNNPTGTSVGAAEFESFVSALPEHVILAVDEAYVEFVRRPDFPDSLAWLSERPGTLVMRTFSKIFGLAGLRIGYGVADPELAGYLNRVRHPFNVNRLAEAAALAALDDDAHAERARRVNAEGVSYLTRELQGLGVEVWPTDANFVLARTGADLPGRLLREGVIVRPLAGFGMPEHARISVGLPEENERLVKTLRELREADAG
ncbi:MAG: histidinol-phosphate transaminase [Myxococcales bacterium]|nr:histidinol-phosphate transaminase [Myxococcales bacterium]